MQPSICKLDHNQNSNSSQVLEGENIEALNVPMVRSSIGVVSQEPVLFRRSIADNIRYGANSREDVTMEEVVAAAKMANIHDFIQSLPEASYSELLEQLGTQETRLDFVASSRYIPSSSLNQIQSVCDSLY